jgi:hypothetical protein
MTLKHHKMMVYWSVQLLNRLQGCRGDVWSVPELTKTSLHEAYKGLFEAFLEDLGK